MEVMRLARRADDHRLQLLRGTAWRDITGLCSELETEDEINTLSVRASFTLDVNPRDRYLPQVDAVVGDRVRIVNAATGGEVFSGIITADDVRGRYTAHDPGWWLGKSELVFQCSGARADSAIERLCAKAGVPVGHIPSMTQQITDIWTGETFARILEDILEVVSTATGRQFLYRIEGGRFWLRDLPDEVITLQHKPADNVAAFDPTWALGQLSGGRKLDDLRNAVTVVRKEGDSVYVAAQAESAASITRFGRIGQVLTLTDDMTGSPQGIAQAALEAADRLAGEYTIEMYGDDQVKSGRVIAFASGTFGLAGKYRVQNVTHRYGRPHRMELTVAPVDVPRAAEA